MARKQRDNWKKLESERKRQIAEVTALFEQWVATQKPVALSLGGKAFDLTVIGKLHPAFEPHRPGMFLFVSHSGEVASAIVPGIYHSGRVEKHGQDFDVTLERFREQISVILMADDDSKAINALLAVRVSKTVN